MKKVVISMFIAALIFMVLADLSSQWFGIIGIVLALSGFVMSFGFCRYCNEWDSECECTY